MPEKMGLTRREFLKDSALGSASIAALGTSVDHAKASAGAVQSEVNIGHNSPEPSYELALAEWPDQLRPIAFLGCKDQLYEFGVMWNGNLTLHTVTMIDADRQLVKDYPDPSLQVSFAIGEKPDFGNRDRDDGTTFPSLAEGSLPITRIRIHRAGVALVQEAFACSSEGTCHVKAWNSPVFLRVRFTVEDPGAGASPIRLWAQLAGNHIHYSMETRRNVRILPIAPLYHDALQASGTNLLSADGRVIMASNQTFQFYSRLSESLQSVSLGYAQLDRNLVKFELPRTNGATVELIFPYLPAESAAVSSVRNLSYGHAYQLVSKSWKEEVGRGMQVSVPEEPLNQLWRFTPPLTFMTADLYPSGDHVLKISSHHYEAMWVTPAAINTIDLIQRGYFEEAANYLEPMLDDRRRRPVPNTGDSYDSSNGFISGVSDYLIITWISDNGVVLWAASEYCRMAHDQKFLDKWLPTMLQSVEWIARERAVTKLRGGGGAGLLPPSRASDNPVQGNFFWNDAWNYRGLAAVCKLLRSIGHDDAARWEKERDDYRACFQKVFRAQLQKTIRWTDRSGAQIPFVPWEIGQTCPGYLNSYFLDGGPMFLGVSGIVDPGDESMTWAMKWFAEGPDAGTEFPDWSNFFDPPSLRYEMSSGEPCYSWNVFMRFMRNERSKFLEGFYSLAAGGVSRKFLGGVETRDGIQALPVTNAIFDRYLRNMLLFENEDERGIELLRNSPSQWLRPGQQIRVQNAPTYFGVMGYEVKTTSESRVEVHIESPARVKCAWIRLYLYHPQGAPLRLVNVNGVSVRPSKAEMVEIRNPPPTLKVVAEF